MGLKSPNIRNRWRIAAIVLVVNLLFVWPIGVQCALNLCGVSCDAKVTRAEPLQRTSKTARYWTLKLAYEYQVQGSVLQGTQYKQTRFEGGKAQMQTLAVLLKLAPTVKVWYLRYFPSVSCVDRKVVWADFDTYLLVMLFLDIPFGIILMIEHLRRRS